MLKGNENKVRMIGPKGKIATVSRKASKSVHLSNIGFRVMSDVIPEVAPKKAAPAKADKSTDTEKQ